MDELFTLLYKKGYASKKLQCFEDVNGGLSVGQDSPFWDLSCYDRFLRNYIMIIFVILSRDVSHICVPSCHAWVLPGLDNRFWNGQRLWNSWTFNCYRWMKESQRHEEISIRYSSSRQAFRSVLVAWSIDSSLFFPRSIVDLFLNGLLKFEGQGVAKQYLLR